MRSDLEYLIDHFRQAQDMAVRLLTQELGFPRPESNRAWACYCRDNRLQVGERNGHKYLAHGYGIELKSDDFTIDFDWGDNGEADGFDGWRLWIFRTDNRLEIDCTHSQVNEWLKTAYNDGELVMDRLLYYDPKRRAS